jgi:predicted N-formylglutamate amidohydrolase
MAIRKISKEGRRNDQCYLPWPIKAWDGLMPGPSLRLLSAVDPAPVTVSREEGSSPFFLTCEHAGRTIPRKLGDLGVSDPERARHIGWDIGAAVVAEQLSRHLGAPLVSQAYSRLVIDCNRALGHPDSIPIVSEHTWIVGNCGLSPAEITARANEIHRPFHDAVARGLDARRTAGLPSILIAVHSFTPVLKGVRRPWHIGLLFNRDPRLAGDLASLIGEDQSVCVGINEPYALSDSTDFTIPEHGEKRGIPHVEIEIRQDLIESADGQSAWANRLADWLLRCLETPSVLSWMR